MPVAVSRAAPVSVCVHVTHVGRGVTAQGRIQRVILGRRCAIMVVPARVAVGMTMARLTMVVFRELRVVMRLVATLIQGDRHLELVWLWNFVDRFPISGTL